MAASPYAKKLAREAGVDYTQAQATGPGGRIVAADVQKLVESGGGKAEQPQEAGAAQPAADAQVLGSFTCIFCRSFACDVSYPLVQLDHAGQPDPASWGYVGLLLWG